MIMADPTPTQQSPIASTPAWVPTRKWNASTFSGALAIVIVWAIHTWKPDIHIPAEIGMAFSTVISGLVAYVTPNAQ